MTETASKNAPPGLVKITDKALQEVKNLYDAEAKDDTGNKGLRLGVKGGGCSGLSYHLAFDARQDNDYIIDANGIPVFVDPKSAIYLKGITLDYQGGLEGKGFVFVNPNASSTCGCGESFSV
jgi:iron-sulfur cluster assembly accessory protein